MPKSVNEQIQDREVRHAIFLEGLKGHEANKVVTFLNKEVLPDIKRQITKALAATPNMERPKGIKSTKRLELMADQVNQIIKDGVSDVYRFNRDDMFQVADMESKFQRNLLGEIIPAPVALGLPSVATLHTAVISVPFQGKTLRKWWESVSLSAQAEITSELNIGMGLGESNQKLAKRIFGIDGGSAFNKMRRNAVTIARTATTAAASEAREETFKSNKSIIKGVRYLATLDARTTDICASLDGRIFKVGQGPRPPMHMRCRSTTTPIVKSFKELGLSKFVKGEVKEGQRSSMNGLVPAKITYPQWLRGQPASVQNMVLGKGKAQIFRSDPKAADKAFERFVDTNFKPISLDRIKKLENIK